MLRGLNCMPICVTFLFCTRTRHNNYSWCLKPDFSSKLTTRPSNLIQFCQICLPTSLIYILLGVTHFWFVSFYPDLDSKGMVIIWSQILLPYHVPAGSWWLQSGVSSMVGLCLAGKAADGRMIYCTYLSHSLRPENRQKKV